MDEGTLFEMSTERAIPLDSALKLSTIRPRVSGRAAGRVFRPTNLTTLYASQEISTHFKLHIANCKWLILMALQFEI